MFTESRRMLQAVACCRLLHRPFTCDIIQLYSQINFFEMIHRKSAILVLVLVAMVVVMTTWVSSPSHSEVTLGESLGQDVQVPKRIGQALSYETTDCDLNTAKGCGQGGLHDGALMNNWNQPFAQPYVPPKSLFMFWGKSSAKGTVASGLDGTPERYTSAQRVRKILEFGSFIGNHFEDDESGHGHFLHSWDGLKFAQLSRQCCTTILVPPMENDLPLYADQDVVARRIRDFVSNGNTLIMTGGDYSSIVFLNNFFHFQLKKTVFDEGPFEVITPDKLPSTFRQDAASLPPTLSQIESSVTSIRKSSLPPDTKILYATPYSTPFFETTYCQMSLTDAECQLAAAEGRACIKEATLAQCNACEDCPARCSCGNIIYLGSDFSEHDERGFGHSSWDKVLRAAADAPTKGNPGSGKFSESIPDAAFSGA